MACEETISTPRALDRATEKRLFPIEQVEKSSGGLRTQSRSTLSLHYGQSTWWAICEQPGHLYIQPREVLQVGGPVTLAFLFCRRCAPYGWQIDRVQLDQPPWSATHLGPDDRFRCPACRGRVDWHIHGPAWRPTYSEAPHV